MTYAPCQLNFSVQHTQLPCPCDCITKQSSRLPPCSSLARLSPLDSPGMLLRDWPDSLPEPLGMSRLPAVPGAFRYPPADPSGAPVRVALKDSVVPTAGASLLRRPCSKVCRSTLSQRGLSNSSSFCSGCRASRICFRVDAKLHFKWKGTSQSLLSNVPMSHAPPRLSFKHACQLWKPVMFCGGKKSQRRQSQHLHKTTPNAQAIQVPAQISSGVVGKHVLRLCKGESVGRGEACHLKAAERRSPSLLMVSMTAKGWKLSSSVALSSASWLPSALLTHHISQTPHHSMSDQKGLASDPCGPDCTQDRALYRLQYKTGWLPSSLMMGFLTQR